MKNKILLIASIFTFGLFSCANDAKATNVSEAQFVEQISKNKLETYNGISLGAKLSSNINAYLANSDENGKLSKIEGSDFNVKIDGNLNAALNTKTTNAYSLSSDAKLNIESNESSNKLNLDNKYHLNIDFDDKNNNYVIDTNIEGIGENGKVIPPSEFEDNINDYKNNIPSGISSETYLSIKNAFNFSNETTKYFTYSDGGCGFEYSIKSDTMIDFFDIKCGGSYKLNIKTDSKGYFNQGHIEVNFENLALTMDQNVAINQNNNETSQSQTYVFSGSVELDLNINFNF